MTSFFRPFQRAICFIFFALLCNGVNAEKREIRATIVQIEGKVELKRAGSHTWAFAKRNQALKNNDMLRTYQGAGAKLKYQDGSIAFGIHASSNALITCMISHHQKDHVHFVDGSAGGYALASVEMKQQLAENDQFGTTDKHR